MKIFRRLVLVLCCTCSAVFADPLINAWTNPASGNWEDLKWSLGIRPGPDQSIMLTNQGWKAIAIGPNTVQNFSETLDVSSVILGGYTDSFNTLLLNYAGFETRLIAGSLIIGTNSGVTMLASVLNVSTNSGTGDISIFNVFNQGENAIVNAHMINLGNLSNPGLGSGTYNQTNGVINADAISGWSGSTFNQFDGANTIVGSLSLGGANSANFAHYRMAGGSLTAGSIELQRGDFNQTGGSVTAGLNIAAATYTLSSGTLRLPGITIPTAHYGAQNPGGMMSMDATLLQTGGTNFSDGAFVVHHEYGFPGVGLPGLGPGRYILSNGVLCVSSTVRSWMGSFQQWGGWHTNAGTEVNGDVFPSFVIHTGSFTLGGGTLITPSISINLGDFTQSAGTNHVSGTIGVGTGRGLATFTLAGGLLTDLNTSIDASSTSSFGAQHAAFTQSGGTHIVTNLLRLTGAPPDYFGSSNPSFIGVYVLSGGVLNVPDIQMATNAVFNHDGGTLTASGLLTLGYATWNEKTTGQQFGQLLLSAPAGTNATFSLPSGNCTLRFATSSSVAWSNQVTLFIDNWNGSPSGGGLHQVIFGSNASGLTAQQLSQIQFRNPAGTSATSPARILSTGEIVPDRFLAARKASNNLVIEWSSGTLQSATNVTGPYDDVSGATSPYTAPVTGLQRFFRIRN
jgi:hypothetical protein